ncbi:MAG: sulfurtransferase [Armatimonadota bacterium]
MKGVVSTEWLADHLNDPGLRILDMRGNFAVYEKNHIPNAQFIHIETLRMSDHGIPCKMHALPVLAEIFGRLGISTESSVIVHATSPADHLSASYGVWTLAVTGNQNGCVLDGHFNKWLAEERSLTQQYPPIEDATYRPVFNDDIFADWRYVRDRMNDSNVVLVDSRSRALYEGTTGPTMRLGHIPGAVLHNFLWDFSPQGTYLPEDTLRQHYEKQGVTPDKEIITYCITGREGSANWYILHRMLGYPRVRLYQASLTEWAAMPELPMVTGPDPYGKPGEEQRRAA